MSKSRASRRSLEPTFLAAQAGNRSNVLAQRQQEAAASEAATASATADLLRAEARCRDELLHTYPFYLVQRLSSRPLPIDDGAVFKYFEPDYMGSAEFENGSIGRSYRRLREHGDFVIVTHHVTIGSLTVPVFFVGPRHKLVDKLAAFELWIHVRNLRGKEWSRFDAAFAAASPANPRALYADSVPDAWWSLDCDLLWTLKPRLADLLLAGLNINL